MHTRAVVESPAGRVAMEALRPAIKRPLLSQRTAAWSTNMKEDEVLCYFSIHTNHLGSQDSHAACYISYDL